MKETMKEMKETMTETKETMTEMKETMTEMKETKEMQEMKENKLPTYRYKATTEITDLLTVFAKTYQHSKREDFKDAWKIWIELNAELIQSETERLEASGYKGDIVDKMFKSARYYYRNKTQKEPKVKKEYEGISHNILEAMDEHIKSQIKNHLLDPQIDISPATSYAEFCENNKPLICQEIQTMNKKHATEIANKFKKTYKNRYYIQSCQIF